MAYQWKFISANFFCFTIFNARPCNIYLLSHDKEICKLSIFKISLVKWLGLSPLIGCLWVVRFHHSDGFDPFKLVIRLIFHGKSLTSDNQLKFSFFKSLKRSFIWLAKFVLVSSLNRNAFLSGTAHIAMVRHTDKGWKSLVGYKSRRNMRF